MNVTMRMEISILSLIFLFLLAGPAVALEPKEFSDPVVPPGAINVQHHVLEAKSVENFDPAEDPQNLGLKCRVNFNTYYADVWVERIDVYETSSSTSIYTWGKLGECTPWPYKFNAKIRSIVKFTGGGYADTGDKSWWGNGAEFSTYESWAQTWSPCSTGRVLVTSWCEI